MAMTTREFIQHLVLNGELDDPVSIEIYVPSGRSGFMTFEPAHVTRIGDDYDPETLVECKPYDDD